MRKIFVILFLFLNASVCYSQSIYDEMAKRRQSLEADYESFRKEAISNYESFRDEANRSYAEFMKNAWEYYSKGEFKTKPKEEQIPPIVISEDDKYKKVEDNPVVIEEEIVLLESAPEPKPIVKVEPKPQPTQNKITIDFYGTKMQITEGNRKDFTITIINPENLSKMWQYLSEGEFDNFIIDCLNLKEKYHLCDWGYLKLLEIATSTYLGNGTNEAELLKAFIYAQSGYQMRLAVVPGNKLRMLYGTKNNIFEKPYWEIDGSKYYTNDSNVEQIMICNAGFPNETPLSFYIKENQHLVPSYTNVRVLQSNDVDWLRAEVKEDKNLIDFYNEYPTSFIGDEIMTRWAIYANTHISPIAKEILYPKLKKYIQGRNESDALNILLHWVQTSLVYEYDDKVWGGDRAFFPDETLFYPYADCEDRSILFTRLVRDLLGLQTALVYYPGHLATAVETKSYIQGDYVVVNGRRFLICDPTYIGAPIGLTMPDMDNKTAKFIELK